MNIHEYQAKELLTKFGADNPRGAVARTAEEAEKVARELGTNSIVVKAQIHAGGRGKGTFTNGFQGGVHLCKTAGQARDIAAKMIGQTLVTHQTGPEGRVVNQVLVAESVEIEKEFYFAILMDRATGAPVIVASREGGMDIEEVAAKSPEKILREPVDPAFGLQPYQTRKLAKELGFAPTQMRAACKLFASLYRCFTACDCSMVEINPLVLAEEDPREVAASKHHLSYIGLDGNIGCMVNGAGLAMATMDIIKHHGGEPANFLDVGGGASEEQVMEAFKILLADSNVKAILVNIFGGIMKCDVIAQGIMNAVKSVKLGIPLVVRLEGTNVEQGRKLLADSGLPIVTATDLDSAASEIVKLAKS
jgi:succinyl-CoA synthetase beta subunit